LNLKEISCAYKKMSHANIHLLGQDIEITFFGWPITFPLSSTNHNLYTSIAKLLGKYGEGKHVIIGSPRISSQ
jgi:hypothetical protein